MSHLCGLCLSLRADHGQTARVTTNVDAVLLSILVAAQRPDAPATFRQTCAFRGFQRAEVVTSDDDAARYAAAVSLVAAGTKLDDHLTDGDTALSHAGPVVARVADRWKRRAGADLEGLGLSPRVITEQVAAQAAVEQAARSFDELAAPTEASVAEVVAHTAVLAGRSENVAPLREVGRAFGRIVYLLDAVEDLERDARTGAFNPLAAAYPDGQRQDAARELFLDAHRDLRHALARVELEDGGLVRKLLVHQLRHTGERVLGIERPDCRCDVRTLRHALAAEGGSVAEDTGEEGDRRLRDRLLVAVLAILGFDLMVLCTRADDTPDGPPTCDCSPCGEACAGAVALPFLLAVWALVATVFVLAWGLGLAVALFLAVATFVVLAIGGILSGLVPRLAVPGCEVRRPRGGDGCTVEGPGCASGGETCRPRCGDGCDGGGCGCGCGDGCGPCGCGCGDGCGACCCGSDTCGGGCGDACDCDGCDCDGCDCGGCGDACDCGGCDCGCDEACTCGDCGCTGCDCGC